jgi:ketosteroid isomerase-like protein
LELNAKIKLDTKSAIQSGELALLRSDWQMTGTGPDGKPFTIAHSSTEVVRRQPDGRWLYVIDHPFGADQMVAAKAH